MPLPENVVDSVTSTNFKVVAEGPAFFVNQMYRDTIGHARRMDSLGEVLVGALAKQVIEIDPAEAISASRALTGDDVALKIASLIGSLGFGQQGAKVAQTTPPDTSK